MHIPINIHTYMFSRFPLPYSCINSFVQSFHPVSCYRCYYYFPFSSSFRLPVFGIFRLFLNLSIALCSPLFRVFILLRVFLFFFYSLLLYLPPIIFVAFSFVFSVFFPPLLSLPLILPRFLRRLLCLLCFCSMSSSCS